MDSKLGEPNKISSDGFEKLWGKAVHSKPFNLRAPSPDKKCWWIELFESGQWEGQS